MITLPNLSKKYQQNVRKFTERTVEHIEIERSSTIQDCFQGFFNSFYLDNMMLLPPVIEPTSPEFSHEYRRVWLQEITKHTFASRRYRQYQTSKVLSSMRKNRLPKQLQQS